MYFTGLLFGLLALVMWPASAWGVVRCVAPGGTGCDGTVCAGGCYSSIHNASVGSVSGDEVRVAAGTWTPATVTNFLDGATLINTKQVVLVFSRNLTIRGGYSTSDWTVSDPDANRTIIDAGGSGRAVTVWGGAEHTVTLDGLWMTGGNYGGLGNVDLADGSRCPRLGSDCGGGLLAKNVRLILQNCRIHDNETGYVNTYNDGGGAVFWDLAAAAG